MCAVGNGQRERRVVGGAVGRAVDGRPDDLTKGRKGFWRQVDRLEEGGLRRGHGGAGRGGRCAGPRAEKRGVSEGRTKTGGHRHPHSSLPFFPLPVKKTPTLPSTTTMQAIRAPVSTRRAGESGVREKGEPAAAPRALSYFIRCRGCESYLAERLLSPSLRAPRPRPHPRPLPRPQAGAWAPGPAWPGVTRWDAEARQAMALPGGGGKGGKNQRDPHRPFLSSPPFPHIPGLARPRVPARASRARTVQAQA